MGVIDRVLTLLFGGGRNALRDTAHVFRENAEAGASRDHILQLEALRAFATEFARSEKGAFDRFMDGVNRLPRPLMALGCIGLFVAAMVEPVWFSARMQGIALVPEPLWWLLGVVVSFYFGARHQAKGQAFQQSIAETLVRTPAVLDNLAALRSLDAKAARSPGVRPALPTAAPNPALEEWRKSKDATM